jgi:hypothetical protein
MTVASQIAHLVMKVQQDVADLVIKGDETLEAMFPPKDEQPEWATFDEDVEEDSPEPASPDGDRRTEGRFALFTTGEPDAAADPDDSMATADPPDVVAQLDYEALTLAQLRARLPSLRVDDLEELLSYEGATKARAPFQTLLSNRITRATAK